METNIEWASHTLNFYEWACQKVSPGCKNCYAESLAIRYGRIFNRPPAWRNAAFKELKTMKPGSVIFVNSMSDTYHESAPVHWIHSIHNTARQRPDVTFLLLTKRIERAYYLSRYLDYPPNLWVGTSVENADYLWRLEYLLRIPAAGHFVSAEPLLSPLPGIMPFLCPSTLRKTALKWVIVGGESGGNRRPFAKAWASEIQELCQEAGVPFMFKQGGAFKPGQDRLLNFRTYDETPFSSSAMQS